MPARFRNGFSPRPSTSKHMLYVSPRPVHASCTPSGSPATGKTVSYKPGIAILLDSTTTRKKEQAAAKAGASISFVFMSRICFRQPRVRREQHKYNHHYPPPPPTAAPAASKAATATATATASTPRTKLLEHVAPPVSRSPGTSPSDRSSLGPSTPPTTPLVSRNSSGFFLPPRS